METLNCQINQAIILVMNKMTNIIECGWCGKEHESILDEYGNETNHECKDGDHESYLESDKFEEMIHRVIWTTGTMDWFDMEGVEKYQEHFKNDEDCKYCKELRKKYGEWKVLP